VGNYENPWIFPYGTSPWGGENGEFPCGNFIRNWVADIFYECILGTTGIRRSLPEHNASDDVWPRSSSNGDVVSDRGQCVWTLQGAGHCAHLLVPIGFAVTLMWICVLWIVVRVLRRRRSAVIRDVSLSSSLCVCRSLGRRDILAWTSSSCQRGNVLVVLLDP